MRSPHFRIFLAVAISASVVFAQKKEPASQATSKPGQQSSSSAPMAMMPQPSSEMQKLISTFTGTWLLSETYEPSEGMPSGGVGQGQQIWRTGPGEFSLIEEYHSKSSRGEISGLSVTWWDEKAQGYRALWCVNTNPGGCIVMANLAKWEGNQFIVGDQFERNGKKFTFKEVVSDITPSSFTQTLYQGESGGELSRLMTIRAARVSNGKKRA